MRFPTETITLPSYETALKVAGALATTAMVCRTISDNLIPESVSDYFNSRFQNFLTYFKSQVTVIIEEFDGLNPNNIFDAANIYLGAKLSPSSHRIKVNLFEKIEELLQMVEATPAEVAGELMKSVDAEVALQGLISFLQNKATPVEQQEN